MSGEDPGIHVPLLGNEDAELPGEGGGLVDIHLAAADLGHGIGGHDAIDEAGGQVYAQQPGSGSLSTDPTLGFAGGFFRACFSEDSESGF